MQLGSALGIAGDTVEGSGVVTSDFVEFEQRSASDGFDQSWVIVPVVGDSGRVGSGSHADGDTLVLHCCDRVG